MSSLADNQSVAETAESTALAALIIELDGVACDSRAAVYRAAVDLLRKAGTKLNPGLFARYGVQGTVSATARELVEKLSVSDLDAASLAAQMEERMAAWSREEAKLSPGVEKLIKAARQRDLPVALLTALPEEAARAALDRLGLTADKARLVAFKDEEKEGFPRADVWLKIARGLGKNARFCVAVAGSHVAAKSALSAGMRCVVVPDSFTAHHDFSGVDVILESWDDMSANELLDAVVPMAR